MKKLIAALSLVIAGAVMAGDAQTPAAEPKLRGTVGVVSCEHIVLWVFLDDGRVARFDEKHKPDKMEEFMKWIKTAPMDVVELPCPGRVST